MTRQELGALLNLEENFIPDGRRNRPGTLCVPNFITIHNTDNPNAGADARSHGRFLINTGHYILNGRQHWVSWHYSVDDHRVVKHLPLNEKAFHAVSGNAQSIGIEICMNQGIDQAKAFLTAARLCAVLLFDLTRLQKDVRKVVPHKFWTGKDCPRLLLDSGNVLGRKWNDFINLIQHELNSITVADAAIAPDMEVSVAMDEKIYSLESIQNFEDFHMDENETDQENNSIVALELELYTAMLQQAKKRGVKVETLINLWLQQKLDEHSINQ